MSAGETTDKKDVRITLRLRSGRHSRIIEWKRSLPDEYGAVQREVVKALNFWIEHDEGRKKPKPSPEPTPPPPAAVDLDAIALAAREGARQGAQDALAGIANLQPAEDTVVEDDSWVDDFGAGLMIDVDEGE
jgi:hypothetical protein